MNYPLRTSLPDVSAESAVAAPKWWPWFVGALFLVALAWRAIVLGRLQQGPLATYLTADAAIYWAWASDLRAGHWAPMSPFFLAPLYPYTLGLMRSLVGDRVESVFWLQAVMGSLAIVALADATRRVASPRAAVVVGILLSGYSMLVLFDLSILSESLLFALGAALVWLVSRGDRTHPLLVGSLVALMALGRPIFILLLLPYWLTFAPPRRQRLRLAATSLLVPALVWFGTSMHHLRTAGGFIPFTYSAGYNAYVGNGPSANGTYVPIGDVGAAGSAQQSASGGTALDGRAFIEKAEGIRLDPAQSDRYWREQTIAFARKEPLRTARLWLFKFELLFNRLELPQVVSATVYERAVGHLGWPVSVEFAVFALGGLIGILVAWRRGPAFNFLMGWVAVVALGTIAFFVVDRYRVHLIPALAPLTGIAISQVAARWRGGDRTAIAALIVGCVILGGLFVCRPLTQAGAKHFEWDFSTTMGEAWLSKNDPRRAVEWFERAAVLDQAGSLRGAESEAGRTARAGTYERLALAYSALGDRGRAIANYATALKLEPANVGAREQYATLLAVSGSTEQAAAQFQRAGWTHQRATAQLLRTAEECEKRGNSEELHRYLAAAVELSPDYEPAVVGLIRFEIMSGNLDAARSRLDAAAVKGMDRYVVAAHRAWFLAVSGDRAGAQGLLRSIPEDVRSKDPRVAGTIDLIRTAAR